MPATNRRWTAAEVRQLIEESPEYCPRYELIDGELLVTPAPVPRHQIALAWLFARLEPYVREQGVGTTLWSPADIELAAEQITQPDVFVVPQLPSDPVRVWAEIVELVLAIDALSPSTARSDRNKKRPYYQRVHVPEYWLVDLDARCIERWRPGDQQPERMMDKLRWHPRQARVPLTVPLAELWRVTAA